jgi:thioredoxin-related protein
MMTKTHSRILVIALSLCATLALAAPAALVVYPKWFKQGFFDLPADLQEARKAGKQGILVFFSMKTCSYCQAILETAFQEQDIVARLRRNYDVIGLEVFSDDEVTDFQGKTHYAKNFAVEAKAAFTPTMIFYGEGGRVQLRLMGYQSPQKMRTVLDYLEGGHDTRLSLRQFMAQGQAATRSADTGSANLNLHRPGGRDKPLLVVFESANCKKCQLLRTMFKADVVQPYLKRLDVVYVNPGDNKGRLTTPAGKTLAARAWADHLGLIHTPAMVFFDQQGKEAVRVDTDILIDKHGKEVQADHKYVLSNLSARLQFVVDGGYRDMPQFQRWRAQQNRKAQ